MVKMNKENLLSVLPTGIAASTELTDSQKKVMGQLIIYSGLDEAKNNDGWFFRKNEALCADAEVSKPTLIEALRKLQAEDLIERRVGSRSVGASEYRVKLVNLDTYPSKGKIGKVENFTNNDDISTMILNELIKLNEAIGKIGKVLEKLDLTQMDVLDAILSMGKISKVDKPTPDTDTDNIELNVHTAKLSESVSPSSLEISKDGVQKDNRKFSEQYKRIEKAIEEVQTATDPTYIEKLKLVMDDAIGKARMYATEKQLSILDIRRDDFKKFLNGDSIGMPEWTKELPGLSNYADPCTAYQAYIQGVCNGLKDTDTNRRASVSAVCRTRLLKEFFSACCEFKGWTPEYVKEAFLKQYDKAVKQYLSPEQPNTTKLPIQASAGEANAMLVVN